MNFATFNLIILVVLIGFQTVLGLLVYFGNTKRRSNQLFALLVAGILSWTLFNLLADYYATQELSFLWTKMTFVAATAIAYSFLLFAFVFPQGNLPTGSLKKIMLAIPPILVVVLVFLNQVVTGAEPANFGAEVILGSLYPVFIGFFLFYLGLAFWIMAKKFQVSKGEERRRILYLFIGALLTAFFASLTNLVLPYVSGTAVYSRFGPYFTIFLVGFTTYAILKHRLLKVRILLTELLSFLIFLIFLVETVLSQSASELFIRLPFLLLVGFFAYLLIRNAIKLDRANRELKRLNQARMEFLSFASHQIKTPLSVIRGTLSMLLDGTFGKITPVQGQYLKKAFEYATETLSLVGEFLDASQIESGNLKLKREKVRLEELVNKVVEELQSKATGKKLKLLYHKPEIPLPKVLVDPAKIQQVMMNLVENAIKYTPKGKVEVSVKSSGSQVLFEVKDTGLGMSGEEVDHLFQKFVRGEGTQKAMIKGTGMGLFLAKKVIEAHGGKIWAESEGKNQGSIFKFSLPVNH